MFFETLINISLETLKKSGHGIVFKRYLPIKVITVKNNFVYGKLFKKSESDYYGIFKKHVIEFEAKQTNDDLFALSNIKKHQLNHLQLMDQLGAISFIALYFTKYDECFFIPFKSILEYTKGSISLAWCRKNAIKVSIIFPGILDLEAAFNNLLK